MSKNFYTITLCILTFLCIQFRAEAQDRQVTGVVTDQQGITLPGVSVAIKGGRTVTVTDAKGVFKASLPAATRTLVFSYIGMQTREVDAAPGQTTLQVTMQTSSRDLNDVVVVGYGSVKKSDLTGSVATIKGGDLNRTPASSVDQLLQGKIAGVQVSTGGGQPGAGATIRIRGASSLNGSKDPLIVVDGYPWGDAGNLKQINPEDIESIEVLKDASSAAIYGSRAANGVIVVTTRKGKAGQNRINFSTLNTISFLAHQPDVWRDPVDEATYANEAAITGGAIATDVPYIGISRPVGNKTVYFPSIAELRGLDPNKPKWPTNTNWVDLVYRNPLAQSYTLTADGGNEKTKYAISGNYYKEDGLSIKNYYDKYTGRMNLDHKISDIVSIGSNIIVAYTKNNGQGLGVGRSTIFPVYDTDGSYFRTSTTDYGNPIALANQLYNTSKTMDLLTNVYGAIKLTSWLNFRTSLNAKFGNSVGDQYDPIGSTQRAMDNKGSVGSIANGNYNDLLSESYFTVDKQFGSNHKFNFVAGFSYQQTTNRFSTLIGQNFVNDVLRNENLATAGTMLVSNSLDRFNLMSYYARANYTFMNRYLFTFTGRADGSTKFGANNKWAYFPSGAFAWKVNEESFMKGLTAISEFKLRANYGITGNQGISPYQTLDRYGSYKYWTGSSFQTGFGPGLAGSNDEQGRTIVSGLGNADLKWETTRTYGFGIDLGFLDQRFTLNADYYDKRTHDLLTQKTLPPSAGFDRQTVNNGEISNKGIELGVNANVVNNGRLNWNIGGNFTVNRGKVISAGETNQVFIGSIYESVRQQISTYTVGQPLYAFYGYKTDGIIKTAAEGAAAGLTGADAQPGEIKYVDISGPNGVPDGKIDSYDRTIIGNPNPKFFYSFYTNLKYMGFDFSVQFYGVSGNDVWDFQKLSPSRLVQRWTPDNPDSPYPRANASRGLRASDFFITDGSFLRIQNVTLGYTFKTGMIKGIKSLRTYLSGNNLYTFTKFHTGFDPEVGELGIANGAYPRPRSISLGINVGL